MVPLISGIDRLIEFVSYRNLQRKEIPIKDNVDN